MSPSQQMTSQKTCLKFMILMLRLTYRFLMQVRWFSPCFKVDLLSHRAKWGSHSNLAQTLIWFWLILQKQSHCLWAPTLCRWRTALLAGPSTWRTTRRGGGSSDVASPSFRNHIACVIGFARERECAYACVIEGEKVSVWLEDECLNVDTTDSLPEHRGNTD